jgi:hypothetical protein
MLWVAAGRSWEDHDRGDTAKAPMSLDLVGLIRFMRRLVTSDEEHSRRNGELDCAIQLWVTI